MKRTYLVFPLLVACGGEFNPNLGDTMTGGPTMATDTEDGTGNTGNDTGSTGDTGDATGSTGDGDGTDTGSTGDTGEAVCGDDVAEGDEECDGDDVLGTSCEDMEFYGGGTVGCSMTCTLDLSDCQDLLYEQEFTTGAVPAEVEFIGVISPQIVYGDDLYGYMGMFNGSCFHGADDYCVQMGPIADNQTSAFKISLQFAAPGEVRSWVWGWTEKFDTLQVLLDGQVKCEHSQNFLAPTECIVPVDTAGFHQLTWIYRKDNTLTEGLDTVWVDSITATNAEPM